MNTRFIAFLGASGASVVVNVFVRIIFSLMFPYEFAILIAYAAGTLTAWQLNRHLVFKSQKSERSAYDELARFAIVNVIGAIQVLIVSVLFVSYVFPTLGYDFFEEITAHIMGLATLVFSSYWLHQRFTFSSVS